MLKGFQKGHGYIGGGQKKECIPWNKGKKEVRENVLLKLKNAHLGKKFSIEHRQKIIASLPRGENHHWFGKDHSGEKSFRWIQDRDTIKKDNLRNDYAYQEWRMKIWMRDGFKCRIVNNDCYGRIEAHHILGWSSHPELRYQINNGITLCHAHHPRKRAEEKRLIPEFMELVSGSSIKI